MPAPNGGFEAAVRSRLRAAGLSTRRSKLGSLPLDQRAKGEASVRRWLGS
jgi:hypothetical protein